MKPSELLLHPVRLRIVQAFLRGDRLTTSDLRRQLEDIPAATLYRQIHTLLEGDVLEVAEEHKVRGAVERTYVLRADRTRVGVEEAGEMSVEQHRDLFLAFAASLMADFERYLEGDDVDLARDQVGYNQLGLNLTDEEMVAFLTELQAVVLPRLALEPTPERTRRIFTTVLMPARDG